MERNNKKYLKKQKVKKHESISENIGNLKNERGITLLALVVTIIVIIILATVAINFAFGENGLIRKAEQARDLYEEKAREEQELFDSIDEGIEDMQRTKWVKTFAGGIKNKVVSVNDKGEMYAVDNGNGFMSLYGQEIEILAENILFSKTSGKYYTCDYVDTHELARVEEIEGINKLIVGNVEGNNFAFVLTDNGTILVTPLNELDSDLSGWTSIDEGFPELQGIKWKEIEEMDTISMEYFMPALLLTGVENETYVLQDGLYNLDELPSDLSKDEIDRIWCMGTDDFTVITKEGELLSISDGIIQNFSDVYPFDKKISNIILNIIETVDGEYYVMQSGENMEIIKLEELYPEIGEIERVSCTSMDGYPIIVIETKTGEFYLNQGNELFNITEEISPYLEGESIVDVKIDENGILYALTATGRVYCSPDKDQVELVAENIAKMENKGDIVTFINNEGKEGILVYNEIVYPSNGGEQKIPIQINNIKEMVNGKILTEEGDLYQVGDDYTITKLNDQYINGNKVIYLSEDYIIDELHNIYEIDSYNSNIEDITSYYQELKDKNVEQIVEYSSSNYVAIVEGGKLYDVSYDGINEIVSDASFAKIGTEIEDSLYLLDSNGNVYLVNYEYDYESGSSKIILEKLNEQLDNKKIIDIANNVFLAEDGSVYICNENTREYINLSNDILKNEEIEQISTCTYR